MYKKAKFRCARSLGPIKKWPWLQAGTLPSTSPAAERRKESGASKSSPALMSFSRTEELLGRQKLPQHTQLVVRAGCAAPPKKVRHPAGCDF